MPKLENYSAPASVAPIQGGRAATPGDMNYSFETVGPAVVKTTQIVMQAKEESETRDQLVKQMQIRTTYNDRLEQAVLTGEDIQPIREQMQNELSKATDGIETRVGMTNADYHAARTNDLFNTKASEISVQRAAAEASVQGQQLIVSTDKILSGDPAYLAIALQDVDSFMATYKGRLPAHVLTEHKQKLKAHFNLSQAMALARLDPVGTKVNAEAGKFDITSEQQQHVINRANEILAAKRADEHDAYAQAKREEKDKSDSAFDDWFRKIDVSGTGAPTQRNLAHAIALDDSLLPERKKELTEWVTTRAIHLNSTEKAPDWAVAKDLWYRITAPDGDSAKIYASDEVRKAVHDGKIPLSMGDHFVTTIANMRDVDGRTFLSDLSSTLLGQERRMLLLPQWQYNPNLGEIILTLKSEAEAKAHAYRGVPGKSPRDILDPNSPDFLFTAEHVNKVAADVTAKHKDDMTRGLPTVKTEKELYNLEVTSVAGQPYIGKDNVIHVKTLAMQEQMAAKYNETDVNYEERIAGLYRDKYFGATTKAQQAERIAALKAANPQTKGPK